jgi:hypothetical protein
MTDTTIDDFPVEGRDTEIDEKVEDGKTAQEHLSEGIREIVGEAQLAAFRDGMDTGVYTNVMGVLVLLEMGASVDEVKANLVDMRDFLKPEITPEVVTALDKAYADALKDHAPEESE